QIASQGLARAARPAAQCRHLVLELYLRLSEASQELLEGVASEVSGIQLEHSRAADRAPGDQTVALESADRKSTRLNSSHDQISYAVFCLKKKNKYTTLTPTLRIVD